MFVGVNLSLCTSFTFSAKSENNKENKLHQNGSITTVNNILRSLKGERQKDTKNNNVSCSTSPDTLILSASSPVVSSSSSSIEITGRRGKGKQKRQITDNDRGKERQNEDNKYTLENRANERAAKEGEREKFNNSPNKEKSRDKQESPKGKGITETAKDLLYH